MDYGLYCVAMFYQELREKITTNLSWLLADLLMLLAYLFFLPRLETFFNEKSFLQGVTITLIYLIFIISVVLIRKLPIPEAKPSGDKRSWLAFFSIFFGLFITYMIAESAGFFSMLQSPVNSQQNISLFWIIPSVLAALLLAFLYLIVVLKKVSPFGAFSHSRLHAVQFLGFIGVNLMILTLTGYWNATFSGVEPYEDLSMGGKVLIFIFVYLFFLLFFAPPRMLFLLRKRNNYSWISFFAQTMFFVWDSLSRFAW